MLLIKIYEFQDFLEKYLNSDYMIENSNLIVALIFDILEIDNITKE